MKILAAGLLFHFISAICAFESNSSLLERKSLPASSSSEVPPAKPLPLSSYVVMIWEQEDEDKEPYIYCLAGILKLDELITTHLCGFGIDIQFKIHNNCLFPQYYATIGELKNPIQTKLKILKPIIERNTPKIAKTTARIKLSKELKLPGINDKHKVLYQKEDEEELNFFTYGLRSDPFQYYKADTGKIELQPMFDGFVTNKMALLYEPVEGSPLYELGDLVGFYTDVKPVSDQIDFHPKRFVYDFIMLDTTKKEKEDEKPKKGKGKKKKSYDEPQHNQHGIWNFGNTYN